MEVTLHVFKVVLVVFHGINKSLLKSLWINNLGALAVQRLPTEEPLNMNRMKELELADAVKFFDSANQQ